MMGGGGACAALVPYYEPFIIILSHPSSPQPQPHPLFPHPPRHIPQPRPQPIPPTRRLQPQVLISKARHNTPPPCSCNETGLQPVWFGQILAWLPILPCAGCHAVQP